MGRPKEHGDEVAEALLEAAEQIVENEGVGALSVRRVADEVGTTTRAVYSAFGSKEGLLSALGTHAFAMLGARVNKLPATNDPVKDLVEAGVRGFRWFAMKHPALFRLAVQKVAIEPQVSRSFRGAADEAMTHLLVKIEALRAADGLGRRDINVAAWEFHALCEGLASLELRSELEPKRAEQLWRDAIHALVIGFGGVRD